MLPSGRTCLSRVFMLILFLVELMAFLATSTDTSVILDTNADTQLRINCEWDLFVFRRARRPCSRLR